MRLSKIWISIATVIAALAFGGIYVSAGSIFPPAPPLITDNPLSPEQFATNVARTNQVEQQDEQTMVDAANGKLGPQAPKPTNPQPLPVPTYPPVVGKIEDVDPNEVTGIAGDTYMYRWLNSWGGTLNSQYFVVTAGSFKDHSGSGKPEPGVLRVSGSTPELSGEFQPLIQSGPLRLTAVDGSVFSLVSTGGDQYQFDILAQTWLTATTTTK